MLIAITVLVVLVAIAVLMVLVAIAVLVVLVAVAVLVVLVTIAVLSHHSRRGDGVLFLDLVFVAGHLEVPQSSAFADKGLHRAHRGLSGIDLVLLGLAPKAARCPETSRIQVGGRKRKKG